ncbi:hypothetical protein [Solimicrobium silvestre]|nr:hypothetical protein [Solimicrobium silvestre]
MVSLCASPASAQGERTFRYLFGYPSKIELTYPSSDSDADSFTLTHLVYAGATGGSAYAFTNDGYKYILYSIEGTGLKRSGLLVQHVGQLHAASDLNCTPSALVESGDELIPKWKADQDIDAHGLPSTR